MAADFFGPVDATLVRVGMTMALTGLLLLALQFFLLWSTFELTAILCSSGVLIAAVGTYLHHANQKERKDNSSARIGAKGKAS
jgi:thiol:disulfide interchange protein